MVNELHWSQLWGRKMKSRQTIFHVSDSAHWMSVYCFHVSLFRSNERGQLQNNHFSLQSKWQRQNFYWSFGVKTNEMCKTFIGNLGSASAVFQRNSLIELNVREFMEHKRHQEQFFWTAEGHTHTLNSYDLQLRGFRNILS